MSKLVKYWSLIVNGQNSELKLEGKHLYEHGIYSVLDNCGHVEALEFFWNKIKSLSEDELRFERKHDIFVSTSVRAASYSDILFEFCIGQVSPNIYPEILKKDMHDNGIYGYVTALIGTWRFDLIKALFDCLLPNDVPDQIYANLLKSLTWDDLPKHYTSEVVKLFVHVYMKEGFVKHRAYVLEKEKIENPENIVVHLIEQNYMEIAFEILDSMPPSKIMEFLTSPQADYIHYLLKRREENDSLNKLVSYTDVTRSFDLQRQLNLNTSPTEAVIKSKK